MGIAENASGLDSSFVEGGRFQGKITAPGGSAYGVMGVATASPVSNRVWSYLISGEFSVYNYSGFDAPQVFDRSRFSVSLNADCGGDNICDVAFLVNPWTFSPFRRVFYVPREALVMESVFEDQSSAPISVLIGGTHERGLAFTATFPAGYAIDFAAMGYGAPIRLPNNRSITARNATNSGDVDLIALGSSDKPMLPAIGGHGDHRKVCADRWGQLYTVNNNQRC